jgi:RimJ/RimL family protein N-acetyltransferase
MTSVLGFATPHLVLAPLEPGDAEALFAYRSDPEVSRYQAFAPSSVEDARHFIASTTPDASGLGWHQLAIRLADSGDLIGDIGFHTSAKEPGQAEVGITFARDRWGRGLASEALGGMLGYLFGELRMHRVFASVDPRNEASMMLFARNGMRREAHFRESVWFKGEWADDVVFAMLASEWEAAQAR